MIRTTETVYLGLEHGQPQIVELPLGAEPLCVVPYGAALAAYFEVDPTETQWAKHRFIVVWSNREFDKRSGKHIGSVALSGGVAHVYWRCHGD